MRGPQGFIGLGLCSREFLFDRRQRIGAAPAGLVVRLVVGAGIHQQRQLVAVGKGQRITIHLDRAACMQDPNHAGMFQQIGHFTGKGKLLLGCRRRGFLSRLQADLARELARLAGDIAEGHHLVGMAGKSFAGEFHAALAEGGGVDAGGDIQFATVIGGGGGGRGGDCAAGRDRGALQSDLGHLEMIFVLGSEGEAVVPAGSGLGNREGLGFKPLFEWLAKILAVEWLPSLAIG